MRVGDLVVHKEARIDRYLVAVLHDAYGMAVSADIMILLVHGNVISAVQKISATPTGNARPYDGNG